MIIKVQGIVLKQMNIGEADKIITLMTDKLGKVQVMIHGARKAKSRFMSSAQVFTYCEYVLFKGKNMYTASQSQIKESFQSLLGDLYTIAYGSYIVELIDSLAEIEEPNISLFAMLLKTLYLLTDDRINREALVRAFELKAISISGYMPSIYKCSNCKRNHKMFNRFSIKYGGLLCIDCEENDKYSFKIDTSTLNTMRFFLRSQLEEVSSIKISSEINNNMKKILKNYIKYYLEKEFKSLMLLDDINNMDKT